ncbi:hypothetical protein CHARACLAT_021544 [Characodon lateralis]|uniref:Uncharacterized protein n=1 Tax=Characodon lateralis TaxID=208331 RepID=A0ABU7DJ54_9TELE|nr:hypothetical protein [Characodon lateralis]
MSSLSVSATSHQRCCCCLSLPDAALTQHCCGSHFPQILPTELWISAALPELPRASWQEEHISKERNKQRNNSTHFKETNEHLLQVDLLS